jgi:hypothetical protein
MAAMGPAGWLVLGVGALATAMVVLGPGGSFKAITSGIGMLAESIGSWEKYGIKKFVELIDGFFNSIGAAIKRTFTGVFDWFKSFVPAWMQHSSYEGGGAPGGSFLQNASYETPDGVESPGHAGVHRLLDRPHGGGGTGVGGPDRGGKGSGLTKKNMPMAIHAMNYLMEKLHWTREGAASAIGQVLTERPDFYTGSGGRKDHGSEGLFQWRLDRLTAGKKWALSQGRNWNDVDTQLDYFDHGPDPGRGMDMEKWRHVRSIHEGNIFGKQFERYAGGLQGRRERDAQGLMDKNSVAVLPPKPSERQAAPSESARGKGDDGHVFHIHNEMTLDGAVVHRSVVKRMVRGMTHPTTAPYHDGSRHWTPPDSGLVGV